MFICNRKYKVKCGDIYLIYFLVTKSDTLVLSSESLNCYAEGFGQFMTSCELESCFIHYASDMSCKSQP